jgi:ATP-dependent DNA helicase RecG
MRAEEWSQIMERGSGQFMELISAHRRGPKGKVSSQSRGDLLRLVAESLGAMANAGGGTVFLGADFEEETMGVSWEDRERRQFMNLLRDSFHPPLAWGVVEEEVLGKTLLRFTVLSSPAVHTQKNDKCYLRVGPQNIPLSREKLAAQREDRRQTWHERETLLRSSWEDLDPTLVDEFMTRAQMVGDPEKLLHRPFGLIEYLEGRAVLTRAAAYLFGRDPLRWHPRPGIEFVRFEGTEERGGEEHNVAERIRVEAPILRLIGQAEKFIGERVKERVLQRDLFFREKFEYPSFSWKEALINAIAHRDYSLGGSPISVWMFDDRIEVRSPGGFPPPVKGTSILRRQKVHYSRNPLMARVLVDAGYMRGTGEGIPRIFQEMEHQGLNPPEWREEGGFCCLVFRNTPVLDETTLTWLQQFSDSPLNPRQKRILAYARLHGGIFSSAEYQKFGVDRDGAYAEIQALVRQGLVEPLKKHGKVYRVRQTGGVESSLAGLTWVIGPLREKGYFTLQELELPPSLSRKKARSMVRRLAEEGYFTPSGKGRAVRFAMTEKLRPLLEKKGFAPTATAAPSAGEKEGS